VGQPVRRHHKFLNRFVIFQFDFQDNPLKNAAVSIVIGREWHKLKLFYRSIIQLVKQACLLPKTIANAVKQRQQQSVLNELEAERLDRIRNPSKYLGK
jgi:hypothetical protein